MNRFARFLLAVFFALAVAGCATTGGSTQSAKSDDTVRNVDPWEGFNRKVFAFNEFVDTMFLRPVTKAYVNVTPQFIRTGISNMYGNVSDAFSFVNDVLQGKWMKAADDFTRVIFNSTLGVGGFIDVIGLAGTAEKGEEDFGQTLGFWGVPTGPYLVLPFLGPSNVRDAVGLVPNFVLDPANGLSSSGMRYALTGLRAIDTRAGLFSAEALLQTAALDKYTFLRSAYLQRRQNLVYDGKPPKDD